MIVNLAIFPIGKGESLSPYIAKVFKIIETSGLPYEHHEMGTNIEGEWDEVIAVIKRCRERLLEITDRIHISISIDDRKGQLSRLGTKVASAKAKM